MMFYKSHLIVGHISITLTLILTIIQTLDRIQTYSIIWSKNTTHFKPHFRLLKIYFRSYVSFVVRSKKYTQVIIYKLLLLLIDFKSCDLNTKACDG